MRRSDERERMLALASDYAGSGLGRAEYSRLHGLHVSKLDYWLRKWRDEQSSTDVLDSEFIELDFGGLVRSDATPGALPDVELELPHGVKLRFFNVKTGQRT